MVILIGQYNRDSYSALLNSMHADRKAVFVDRLGWDIPHTASGEYDAYDHAKTEYFVCQDPVTGVHDASLRLLSTEGEHMMSSLFRGLVAGDLMTGPDVREISRMCVSPRLTGTRCIPTFNKLATSLVEYALEQDIRHYTLVANVAGLRQVRSVGWRCHMLGHAQDFGGERIAAMSIDINSETIGLLGKANRWSTGFREVPTAGLNLAA